MEERRGLTILVFVMAMTGCRRRCDRKNLVAIRDEPMSCKDVAQSHRLERAGKVEAPVFFV